MKYELLIFLLILLGSELAGQTVNRTKEGKISYVTSQNIYVKFQSTENIAEGDTLFVLQGNKLTPVLIVKVISSISCACIPISTLKLSVGDQVLSGQKTIQPERKEVIAADIALLPPAGKKDTVPETKVQPKKRTQIISGRISISSYSNFSGSTANSQRMRYTFSMDALNIGNTKLSGEAYISFVHKLGEWTEIQDDIFNGLKIYSLAFNYVFNKSNKIWLGRKINPRISNMGAIDGLQYELKLKSFTIGIVGGFRPDYKNYSFNPDLFQFGSYLGHDYSNKNGSMQTTLAFVEQMYNGKTDRRFAYLQHSNSLLSNLYFFGSVEAGLYKKVMNPVDTVQKDTTYKKDNSPTLSNLYLSLRYRPIRQLSLSISYSALQNIIYYESYPKNFLERMLEIATVQGFMFQGSYQPVKYLSIGINAGYRNSKKDPRPTKNFYGYVTYSRIPGIDVSATASVTMLEASYISGNIYNVGISRDLAKGKLYLGLNYKYVDYRFSNDQPKLAQNMGELNITWRIYNKLSCSFYYEGTFENANTFNRVYINLTQRF
jgi:hypothetical protein